MNIKRISVLTLSCCAILTSCNGGFRRHSFNECDYTTFANALKSIKAAQTTKVGKVTNSNLPKEGNIELVNRTNTQYKTNGETKNYYQMNLKNNYSWNLKDDYVVNNYYKTAYNYNINYKFADTSDAFDENSIRYNVVNNQGTSNYHFYTLINDLKTNKKYQDNDEELTSDFNFVNEVTEDLDSQLIVSRIPHYGLKGMVTGSSKDEYYFGLEDLVCIDTLPKLVRYYQELYNNNKEYSVSLKYGSNDNTSAMVEFNAIADIYLFGELFKDFYIHEQATDLGGKANINIFLAYENNFISQIEFTLVGSYSYNVGNDKYESSYDSYFLINRTNSCASEKINISDFKDKKPTLR